MLQSERDLLKEGYDAGFVTANENATGCAGTPFGFDRWLTSRAPAQPAAPTPDPLDRTLDVGDGKRMTIADIVNEIFPEEKPAAPEPSAELDWPAMYAKCETELTATQEAAFAHAAARESAEAQLAAVRNAVLVSGISEQRADDAGRLAHAIRALLTPTTSPGAGKGPL